MHDTGKLKHMLGKIKYQHRASIPQIYLSIQQAGATLSELTLFLKKKKIDIKRNNGMQFHSTPQDGASKAGKWDNTKSIFYDSKLINHGSIHSKN